MNERARIAAELLQELRHSRLVVIKFRTAEGGYNRASISQNPPWYQSLCSREMRGRRRYPRPRTIIKRVDTIKALEKIARGRPVDGVYMERLIAVVDQEIEARSEVTL